MISCVFSVETQCGQFQWALNWHIIYVLVDPVSIQMLEEVPTPLTLFVSTLILFYMGGCLRSVKDPSDCLVHNTVTDLCNLHEQVVGRALVLLHLFVIHKAALLQ